MFFRELEEDGSAKKKKKNKDKKKKDHPEKKVSAEAEEKASESPEPEVGDQRPEDVAGDRSEREPEESREKSPEAVKQVEAAVEQDQLVQQPVQADPVEPVPEPEMSETPEPVVDKPKADVDDDDESLLLHHNEADLVSFSSYLVHFLALLVTDVSFDYGMLVQWSACCPVAERFWDDSQFCV